MLYELCAQYAYGVRQWHNGFPTLADATEEAKRLLGRRRKPEHVQVCDALTHMPVITVRKGEGNAAR